MKTLLTSSAVNLAPVHGEWRGQPANPDNPPALFLIGRRGQPACWSPFANEAGNYNVAVTGKSVLMQELVTGLIGAGGEAVVIDDGRSFQHTAETLDGAFIAFGKDAAMLNPFAMIDRETAAHDGDYREECFAILAGVIGRMCRRRGSIDDIEAALIDGAIGVQAITYHHLRVRFFSTIELVNSLEHEKAHGKPGQIANRLVQVDLVILDELGYLPFSQAGGALLFHLMSKLYERTSMVLYVIWNMATGGLSIGGDMGTQPGEVRWERFPSVAALPEAKQWLEIQSMLRLAHNTVEAYGRGLEDYLRWCARSRVVAGSAGRDDVARYVGDLRQRRGPRGGRVVVLGLWSWVVERDDSATPHRGSTVLRLSHRARRSRHQPGGGSNLDAGLQT